MVFAAGIPTYILITLDYLTSNRVNNTHDMNLPMAKRRREGDVEILAYNDPLLDAFNVLPFEARNPAFVAGHVISPEHCTSVTAVGRGQPDGRSLLSSKDRPAGKGPGIPAFGVGEEPAGPELEVCRHLGYFMLSRSRRWEWLRKVRLDALSFFL